MCINPFWENRGCSQINESKIRSLVHSRAKTCRHGGGDGGGDVLGLELVNLGRHHSAFNNQLLPGTSARTLTSLPLTLTTFTGGF